MFDCFVCGNKMSGTEWYGFCDSCQVSESRQRDPYYCRTTHVRSQPWYGETEIFYLDHSGGSYPSPA
jgi:hypothetical protein